jgi:hypothetical protein
MSLKNNYLNTVTTLWRQILRRREDVVVTICMEGKIMTERLLVAVLGHKNAGKSRTWTELFDATVKTSAYGNERVLSVSQKEWVSVFLVNGSPAERGIDVKDIINPKSSNNFESPRIVLCSMQYPFDIEGTTLQYFIQQGYYLFIHWLNPGFHDPQKYNDDFGCIPSILHEHNSLLGIRDGKTSSTSRVNEIRDFIRGWANTRGLLKAV